MNHMKQAPTILSHTCDLVHQPWYQPGQDDTSVLLLLLLVLRVPRLRLGLHLTIMDGLHGQNDQVEVKVDIILYSPTITPDTWQIEMTSDLLLSLLSLLHFLLLLLPCVLDSLLTLNLPPSPGLIIKLAVAALLLTHATPGQILPITKF